MLSRRDVLRIGASSLGVLLIGCRLGRADSGPGSFNTWVRIASDNSVVLIVAQTEMGQGVHTSLPMLLAEELEVELASVRVEMAPSEPAYRMGELHQMRTENSQSVRLSFQPLRLAGATARVMLVEAAAARWQVSPRRCTAALGRVRCEGRTLSYGELAEAAALREPPSDVSLKPRDQWKLLGHSTRRLEGAGKLRGEAVFGTDVQVPGMLVGTVVRCPVLGGRLERVEPAQGVVELPDGVAVLSESFWEAQQKARNLQLTWSKGSLDSAAIEARMREALEAPGLVAEDRGQVDPALAGCERVVTTEFSAPLLAHAALEPVNATVRLSDRGAEVWAPTQVQSEAQQAVAELLGIAPGRVQIHTTLAGGSFGRQLEVDCILQATRTARTAGRPVKLIWTRSEDMQHDFYRPPALGRVRIGLDAGGRPVAWDMRVATPSLMVRRGSRAPVDPLAVEGAVGLSYRVPHWRVTFHPVKLNELPLGFWRSVGHSCNTWFVEHALDQAALAGGLDPVELRLSLLGGREQAVLRATAWDAPPATGRFRGSAVCNAYGSVAAHSVEISVAPFRVERVRVAVDCGPVVNPRHVEAQMEGSVAFGLSAALHGEITLSEGRVQQANFDSYRLLTPRECPEITVVLVPGLAAEPGGIGEVGVPSVAPALCNALLAASGNPVNRLPIERKRRS